MPSLPASGRGYVTIATGSKHYYQIAYNLLRSYRRNGGGSYPFAILAEEENEYTRAFDKVVLIPNPSGSYMDKIRIFDHLPYEETIFIDADCLVYGRVDEWWNYFKDGPDFSCFGYAYDDLSVKTGWFLWDGMKEFREKIRFIPTFSGGVYYIRNTPTAEAVFRWAKYAVSHYGEYPFAIFKSPADEPVLAFGMAICNCRPVDLFEVGIYVKRRDLPMDILAPAAQWTYRSRTGPVRLVHWGNLGTMKAKYLLEVQRMDRDLAGKTTSPLNAKLRYCFLLRHDGVTLLKRVFRKFRSYSKKTLKRLHHSEINHTTDHTM